MGAFEGRGPRPQPDSARRVPARLGLLSAIEVGLMARRQSLLDEARGALVASKGGLALPRPEPEHRLVRVRGAGMDSRQGDLVVI